MQTIDWRRLYADNQAAIDGRRRTERPRARDRHVTGGPVVHTPHPRPDSAAPLVVMLHGCTQTAASFAAATAMTEVADRHGFVVLFPEQMRARNRQGCWNWFLPEHQVRDGGEPASIAAATRAVVAGSAGVAIDPRRVVVAGLSAGGAMASILAATHPDLFAAVAIHSGLAYAAAASMSAAFAAMSRGVPDPELQGEAALAAMGGFARPMPTMVLHGTADHTVAPVNGEHAARQWLATNRRAGTRAADLDFARPSATTAHPGGEERAHTSRRWLDADGRLLQELVTIDGLGHAWSGGARGGSHADPQGPSAADAIWGFFAEVTAPRRLRGAQVRSSA
jgi:poly(hydroxyalkanoate) depolymerase family esterase